MKHNHKPLYARIAWDAENERVSATPVLHFPLWSLLYLTGTATLSVSLLLWALG